MKIKNIMAAIMLLPMLYGCQSDELRTEEPELPQDNVEDPEEPVRPLRITASLPGKESRAQVTYGNPNREAGEEFIWNDNDELRLFNITKLSEQNGDIKFRVVENNRNSAEFEWWEDESDLELTYESGDIILAVLGESYRNINNQEFIKDGILTMGVGTEANKPQLFVDDPDDSSLEFMKDNIKMYALVKVDEEGNIPPFHFRHLSAIIRVTFTNATGEDLFPTKIEFKYPEIEGKEKTEVFLNTTLYFSITPEDQPIAGNKMIGGKNMEWSGIKSDLDGYNLLCYTGDALYNGSNPYTNKIGTTLGHKIGTVDADHILAAGRTYDLYLATVPRINNDLVGENGIRIEIVNEHITATPYYIDVPNFNVAVQAGMRYGFSLTAVPGSKQLVFSSQYNP
ncbi:MAG: hypothetical protein K2M04_00100 [Muribaculaceae bacterium]|nr:hypothetical protein [Muribaculaceae bacterium]